MKKQILAADDLRKSDLVRKCAIQLAQQLKVSVELVHTVDPASAVLMGAPDYGSLINESVRSSKEALDKVEISSPVKIKKKHIVGPAAASLIKLAQNGRANECIVVGTQGNTGVGRLLLGSVAEEVVRFSKIPVVIVGRKVESIDSNILKILVATDLGPNSKKAEDYALKLAKAFHAEIVFVHCLFGGLHHILQMAMASPNSRTKFNQMLNQLKLEIGKKLERKVATLRKKGIQASYVDNPEQHPASEVLLKEIKKTKSNLVFMGTHGRNLFGQAFFGGTVREVVLNSPVPVVTVKSK